MQISENDVNPPQMQRVFLKPSLCKIPYPFSPKESRGPVNSRASWSPGMRSSWCRPAGVWGRVKQVESGRKDCVLKQLEISRWNELAGVHVSFDLMRHCYAIPLFICQDLDCLCFGARKQWVSSTNSMFQCGAVEAPPSSTVVTSSGGSLLDMFTKVLLFSEKLETSKFLGKNRF